MKLTKEQVKQHESALRLLEKPFLTTDEKEQVYRDYYPAYGSQIGKTGAFFTPPDLAHGLCCFINGHKVIDLCAGIGILSFYFHQFTYGRAQVTCIEKNPEFVEVGKKLLPEANWICSDILDENVIKTIGKFDFVFGNPPFGNIQSNQDASWLPYKGPEFEYKAVAVGSFLATDGAFILPQMSVPFKYSGNQRMCDTTPTNKYKRFNQATGLRLEMNCGYDTAIHKDDWKGTTNMITEIALCDYMMNYDD
ncbi:methyltransferase [Bacteroides thetaiotaomicron]|uniref:methyltransferase n=1 Tax=Bacteroides thetaiotaomicron TaxID=818 RepID=UPI0039C3F0E9